MKKALRTGLVAQVPLTRGSVCSDGTADCESIKSCNNIPFLRSAGTFGMDTSTKNEGLYAQAAINIINAQVSPRWMHSMLHRRLAQEALVTTARAGLAMPTPLRKALPATSTLTEIRVRV